ncbi:MAG TPA: queuosine salvage family protein [Solirubrobacteraceae bacterium]
MTDVLSRLREACAEVASRSRSVAIDRGAIAEYAATLPLGSAAHEPDPSGETRDHRAAFWLTLDAINFGSGWSGTLRKAPGRSGYATTAAGVAERLESRGPWSAAELAAIGSDELAGVFGQDAGHELMALFATSLNDFGNHLSAEYGGSFTALVDSFGGSVVALVTELAGWECFADTSTYDGLTLPFLKRAQIAAADLARAGVWDPADLDRLTMFADNLVPHVLRLDGILRFDPELVARIDREELIVHGSPEEVEIRACAVEAVELIVAARPGSGTADVDQTLWLRGQGPRYKASPRHRSRSTAY